MINIQGLTTAKMVELQEMLCGGEEGVTGVLCLTETKQKYHKVDFGDWCIYLEKMRDLNDKKGGGIMAVMKREDECSMEEVVCQDCAVMRFRIYIGSTKMHVLLVYVDGKVDQRMENSYRTIEREVEKIADDESLLVLGDFIGHVGFF